MVGVYDPLLGEDGWSKLRRILSQANLSLTSFGPARDAMVGHYLGVDPGREDDWKSPASAEEVGKQDEEEDAEEGGYQVN